MAYLPSGPDLRDLYRSGSGLTLRRLKVLLSAAPEEAWAIIRHAVKGAEERSKVERIRNRKAEWEAQNRAALEREASA